MRGASDKALKLPFKKKHLKKILKKFKKAAVGFSVLFTAALFFVILTPVANYMARPLIVEPEIKKTGLIAVLGGGAYDVGVLSPQSSERLIHGLTLLREGYAPRIIFVGGSIKGTARKLAHTLSRSNDASAIGVVEATIMETTSRGLGFEPEVLDSETRSTHTYGNVLAIKSFMEAESVDSCLVVTSPTHMRRAMAVTERLGLDCTAAPVADYTRQVRSYLGRITLMRKVLWEYAAFVLYRWYGYI